MKILIMGILMLTSLSASALDRCSVYLKKAAPITLNDLDDLDYNVDEMNDYHLKYEEQLAENLQLLGYNLVDSSSSAKYVAQLETFYTATSHAYANWGIFELHLLNQESRQMTTTKTSEFISFIAFNKLINTIEYCQ